MFHKLCAGSGGIKVRGQVVLEQRIGSGYHRYFECNDKRPAELFIGLSFLAIDSNKYGIYTFQMDVHESMDGP